VLCWLTEELWLGKCTQISCKVDNQERTVCHDFFTNFHYFFFSPVIEWNYFFCFTSVASVIGTGI